VEPIKLGLAGLEISITAREAAKMFTTYAYLPETKTLRAPLRLVPGTGPRVSAIKLGLPGLEMSNTARASRV
jgi:hypothetical protein